MRKGTCLALLLALGSPTGALQAQDRIAIQTPAEPLVLKERGSFFIGGQSVEQTPRQLSSIFGKPLEAKGHVTTGQMYVDYMVPQHETGVPIVMGYDTTPDGRMGWYEYVVRHGHAAYIPDQIARGRSGFDIAGYNEARLGVKPASTLPNPDAAALAQLARKVSRAVAMGHSETVALPLDVALTDNGGLRALVLVEPGSCGATHWNDQQIARLAQPPILVIFGDHLATATGTPGFTWKAAHDDCTAFIARVNKGGGKATMLWPPALGIHGNSHLWMMDRNNLQIADLILTWIDGATGHGS